MKIGIINYSLGNVGSVMSAFEFYNLRVSLIKEHDELKHLDILVLAGVGNFMTAVKRIKALHFLDELNTQALIKKKPVLGICLGMQLFADTSAEGGLIEGFGWIPGKVLRIEPKGLKVPHIGWNQVSHHGDRLFDRMKYGYFYFMHSYHFVPEDSNAILARVRYGDLDLVSAVRKDNLVGVQFHPEKSQGDGLRFIANFIKELS